LKHKGYHVTAVNIPLTSLADDAAATKAVIDAKDGPTVLVGHSWGGFVIGEVGNDPKVSALVYLSAFAPEKRRGSVGRRLRRNSTPLSAAPKT
jgi:pimeloyl-ACP methyl ester carboxylesterase